VFYKIRINLESKELTTFCIRYRTFKAYILPFRLMNSLVTY